jgi:hypothetical protein
MTISGSGSHRRPRLSHLARRALLRPGRPQRTPPPRLRRRPDRRRRRPPHQHRCPHCRPGRLPRRPSGPARNLNTPANADRTGVSMQESPAPAARHRFALPLAGDWQTVRNDAGSGPAVNRIASTVALTLAAAAGAGSAAAQPALAGALPAGRRGLDTTYSQRERGFGRLSEVVQPWGVTARPRLIWRCSSTWTGCLWRG